MFTASIMMSANSAGVGITGGSGNDGSAIVSINFNINTSILASGRTVPDAVNYSVIALTSNSATLSTTPSLIAGDEILLINLQGTSSNYINVGNYETLIVQSVNSNTITFNSNKVNYYGNGSSDDTNVGTSSTNQRVMIQRVPNYNDLTVNSGVTLYASAWDGTKNGVLFFRVAGILLNNGAISMDSQGYRSGVGTAYNTGQRAESYAGHPGDRNWPRNFGGGGGGPSFYYATCGGGGGGHLNYGNAAYYSRGEGGSSYGNAELSKIYMGSGGGGGGTNDWKNPGDGGRGGGIVYIDAKTLNVPGSVYSRGANGSAGEEDTKVSGGGGGAGGSIYIKYTTVTALVTVNANGGTGGANIPACAGANGSVGRIRYNQAV